jgi:hypothetical protein
MYHARGRLRETARTEAYRRVLAGLCEALALHAAGRGYWQDIPAARIPWQVAASVGIPL